MLGKVALFVYIWRKRSEAAIESGELASSSTQDKESLHNVCVQPGFDSITGTSLLLSRTRTLIKNILLLKCSLTLKGLSLSDQNGRYRRLSSLKPVKPLKMPPFFPHPRPACYTKRETTIAIINIQKEKHGYLINS